jgi:hypothetical protein
LCSVNATSLGVRCCISQEHPLSFGCGFITNSVDINPSPTPRTGKTRSVKCDLADLFLEDAVGRPHLDCEVKHGHKIMCGDVTQCCTGIIRVTATQNQITTKKLVEHNLVKGVAHEAGYFGGWADLLNKARGERNFPWPWFNGKVGMTAGMIALVTREFKSSGVN